MLIASTSLGNPPVMVYLLSGRDSAATNRANFTGYFAVTLIALIALMAATGLIDRASLITAALLLPVFMAGAFVGSRLFRKSSEALYRRVALAPPLLRRLLRPPPLARADGGLCTPPPSPRRPESSAVPCSTPSTHG